MPRSCSAGVNPSAGASTTPPAICCLSPATRIMKGSSSLEAEMARNLTRSVMGTAGLECLVEDTLVELRPGPLPIEEESGVVEGGDDRMGAEFGMRRVLGASYVGGVEEARSASRSLGEVRHLVLFPRASPLVRARVVLPGPCVSSELAGSAGRTPYALRGSGEERQEDRAVDPCSWGSGKKYKLRCGGEAETCAACWGPIGC